MTPARQLATGTLFALLAASARGSRRALGRALLNERRLAKPATPLTRHWMERMAVPEHVRA